MNYCINQASDNIKYKNSFLIYKLLLIQLIAVYFQYSFNEKHASQYLKVIGVIDELIAILFIAIMVIFNTNKVFRINKIFLMPVVIIIPYMFLTAYLNSTPLVYLIFAYRAYFIYFPTVFLLYLYLDGFHILRILKIFGYIAIFEFILIIVQALRNIITGSNIILGDAVSGTFAGANNFGYVISMILIFYIVLYAYKIHIYSKKFDKYIIILSFLAIFLVEARASLFSFVIIFPMIIFISQAMRKYLLKNLIYISALSLFGIVIFSAMYSSQGSFSNNNIVNAFNITQTLENENNVYSGSNRFLWFPLTYLQLEQFAYHPLIGMGPSTHSSYAAVTLNAPIAMNYVLNAFGQKDLGMDGGVDSQIIPIWAEYGYLGIFLFYSMFVLIFIYFKKQYNKFDNGKIKAYSVIGMSLTIYMVVMSYANHVWEAQVESFTYWVMIASCLKIIKIEKEKECYIKKKLKQVC